MSRDAEVSWLGVVARGAFPAVLSLGPVAVAADSPLTVAGAAPVLHRTSLSHRWATLARPEGAVTLPLDRRCASFETPAGRAPQDDVLSQFYHRLTSS